MTDVHIRHRVLGMALARCRRDRGLTTRQAAPRLGMSSAAVNRSENAKRPFGPVEVGAALAVYQPPPDERARVLALAQGQPATGWWQVPGAFGPHDEAVAVLEASARSVVEFSATALPLVAQTPHYTRALCWHRRHEEHAALTRAGRRREILLDPTQPDRTLILDEAVLRRPVGGPTAMAQQLRHLVALVRGRPVAVRVVPFREGGYRSPGDCAVYRITDAPTVVHLHSDAASGLLDDPADTRVVEDTLHGLLSIAASPDDSVDLLTRFAADHERTAGLYP
ncbi:helix-turn-helix domain-containing protein [Actinokineospora spheciospongiae]|uniref:helix-turn-helix domain-containing protein n=1 Tax=Actinokineospora spheciospongiae TaxID=909613 RepID=UPI000D70B472|nr:helix-turn-helix transcriptional regulator [Actinokineospora spheciospongiae]PWW62293.1 helix-turn-helix protein [Actinokineospora spheciospongiae]